MRSGRRTTVGQALYQSLKLPLPTQPAECALPLLIYGGSTATGTLAIQFAELQVSHLGTAVRLQSTNGKTKARIGPSSQPARRGTSLWLRV